MIFKYVIRNDIKLVEEELKKGVDINSKDKFGNTLLHIACLKDYCNIAKFLIENSIKINEKGINDYTPLHTAVQKRHYNFAKLLINYGAIVNCKDDYGNTPLITAVMNYRNDDKMIKLLLENGGDASIKNNYGISLFKFLKIPRNEGVRHLFSE